MSKSYISVFVILGVFSFCLSCKKESDLNNNSCYDQFCGDFEDLSCVAKYWTLTTPALISNEEKFNGLRSLRLNKNKAEFKLDCLERNKSYNISFALKICAKVYQQHPIYLLFGCAIPGKQNLELSFVNTDTNWVQKNYHFTADTTKEKLYFDTEADIPIFIDDLKIE